VDFDRADPPIDVAATEDILTSLQRRWPDEIALRSGIPSEYYRTPFHLLAAFASLTPASVMPLALFCHLYAGSIFLQDKLIDGEAKHSDVAALSLRVMAMQAEAYHVLHQLFPPSATFWARFRVYMADYAAACLEERRFATGARPFREYTEDIGLMIAVGKNGLARSVVAAMVDLAGDERMLDPLLEIINAFNKATQMLDDLQDWKVDLKRGAPSLLLARVISHPPRDLDDAAWRRVTARVARELYYDGHVSYVVGLALACLDAAERLKPTLPGLGLYGTIAILRRRCEALRQDLDRIVRQNIERAGTAPRLDLHLPEAEDQWQGVAWTAVSFLTRQWRLGFGEARDLMHYPEALGLGSADICYFGDVFQRALIADALCDVNGAAREQLRPVLDSEAAYLLSQRLPTDTGGWRYFQNLAELPPDADDLAQVMQVLLRLGRREDVASHCEAPLAVLLRDNAYADGSFETWIVPRAGRTELEERHAELLPRVWGSGPDCDVMPNLLYALHLYGPKRFSEIINKVAAYLERRQNRDGTWISRWYHGPFYAIHAVVRLLAAVKPDSPAIGRALQFLRESQRDDGSVGGTHETENVLSTALSLLALAEGHVSAADPGDFARATRMLAILRSTGDAERGWPAEKLVFKGVQAHHGSRTLTTTFVLKAVTAWAALAAAQRIDRSPQGGGAGPRRME
jgi:squalene-hopene/tetraprenyl-beta-curcumene cyclase